MESQPQIPKFRNNPENFHPCIMYVMLQDPQSVQMLVNVSLKLRFIQGDIENVNTSV